MPSILELYYPIICGAIAASASIAGGFWLAKQHKFLSHEVLHLGIASSAGFLLAAVLLEIIPESITNLTEISGNQHQVMLLVLTGYLSVIFLERIISPNIHVHFEATIEPSAQEHDHNTCGHFHREQNLLLDKINLPALLSGLLIHAFFDGVSIASGFLISQKLGWIIFIALLLHKIPDGITVVSVVLASGRSQKIARLATLCTGAATLVGAIAMIFMKPIVPYVLPLSAGVTLHVAASDLVPEIIGDRKDLRTPIAILIGVLFFYTTHLLLTYVTN